MTVSAQVLSARIIPRNLVTTIALIAGFAGLTALAAQIRIPLPFTPVPITGQTFAVLLSGAVLGSWAGSSSQLLYIGMGAIGWPVFAGGTGGWEVVSGTTGGYLVGFVLASGLVGWLAEKDYDRRLLTTFLTFATGTLVIYLCGVAGLMVRADMTLSSAIANGVTPFLVGDLVKAAAAGVILPTAWKLLPPVDRP